MTERQKVYVLRIGAYSDQYVAGVYATPEAAMAAQSVSPEQCLAEWHGWDDPDDEHEHGWVPEGPRGGGCAREWRMTCRGDFAAIDEYELEP